MSKTLFIHEVPMSRSLPVNDAPSRNDAERPESASKGNEEQPTRGPNGRFLKGNPGGPGNPFARECAMMRKALMSSLTYEEMKIIGAQVVCKAKMGDLAAAKLVFQYILGKPAPMVDPDDLDIHEMKLYQSAPKFEEVTEVIQKMPSDVASGLCRTVLPFVGQTQAEAIAECVDKGYVPAPPAPADPYASVFGDDDDDDDDMTNSELEAEGKLEPAAAAAAETPSRAREAAPSPNRNMNAGPRHPATRPSANDGNGEAKRQARSSDNGDNGRHGGQEGGGRGCARTPRDRD